jgi:hypothetical protein
VPSSPPPPLFNYRYFVIPPDSRFNVSAAPQNDGWLPIFFRPYQPDDNDLVIITAGELLLYSL